MEDSVENSSEDSEESLLLKHKAERKELQGLCSQSYETFKECFIDANHPSRFDPLTSHESNTTQHWSHPDFSRTVFDFIYVMSVDGMVTVVTSRVFRGFQLEFSS